MPLRHWGGPALVIAVLALALPGHALAAPGDLDGAFAVGGLHVGAFQTTFPGNDDAQKVAVDSQGRVYLAATREAAAGGGTPRSINVQRLTPQGQLDTGYGTGGTATLPIGGDAYLAGLAIDGQDRVVLAGVVANVSLAVGRLTTAGQPDPAFNGAGYVVTGLSNTTAVIPEGVATDQGGGVLVGATVVTTAGSEVHGAVSRFKTGGTLDTSYGTGGTTFFGPAGQRLNAIAAVPGGGAFAIGRRDYDAWGIVKLDAGGTPDPTFDGDGFAETSLGKQAADLVNPNALSVDLLGRPVAGGQLTSAGDASAVVARFTTTGALDASFGAGVPTAGAVLVPGVGGALVRGLVVAGERIFVTGGARRLPPEASTNGIYVAALTADGALDPAFAPAAPTPGVARINLGTYTTSTDITTAGTTVLVAGFRRTGSGPTLEDFPLVGRLLGFGGPAPTPPAPAAPAPAPPVPASPKPTPVTVATAVRFPSTKVCASRRSFAIRLRVAQGAAVSQATVLVNGRRVAVRNSARLRSVVDLRSLPKGRFRVEVRLRLADGTTLRETRRYRTCAPKRRR